MSVKEFFEEELNKRAEKLNWLTNNRFSTKKAQVEYETTLELYRKVCKIDVNEEVDPLEDSTEEQF